MTTRFLLYAAMLICISCMSVSTALGAPQPENDIMGSGGIRKDVPTTIRSNNMRYDANKLQIVFDGKVQVRRPDFDLDAKRLTVYLKPAPEKPKSANDNSQDIGSGMNAGDIDRMVATGSVHIVKEGRTGDAEKVTFFMDDGLLVMEGNPILRENKNTIRGTVVKFYTKENRSEVIGSNNTPVEVLFSVPPGRNK